MNWRWFSAELRKSLQELLSLRLKLPKTAYSLHVF
jgi:hypothetical protein